MPPSYREQFVFGDCVKMTPIPNPRRCQSNMYPGLDGIEELDMGASGGVTIVSGRIASQSREGLGALMNIWNSLKDGLAGVLIDNEGRAWPNVKLDVFEPTQGSARAVPGYGYTRTYSARFRHLS